MEKEFVNLLNAHPGILYKICHLYCGDEEDRKDLFQEMVLQLWKAFPAFRREAKASTWMYRVALNTAVSNFRQGRRNPRPAPLSSAALQIPDLATGAAGHEEMAQLYAAIEHLTAVEKALVMLYLDEKTYEEMAIILGIGKSNVGTKLSRIRAKLERMMKPVAR
ncbi:MAG: sigma-70 family RNA polymerase sigma factor [Ferruginibacter sp.]|nr:sigma-70 family RNA polymerase sigma factor [Cytophagales bacterium]